jgi:hypothetical protein
MKHMYPWFLIGAIISTCGIGLAVMPQDEPNHPVVLPSTGEPTPLGNTNQTSRTSTNSTLPPAYQGGIKDLHDTIGTNAVNHGYNQPTLTNQPNPDMQVPHVPPQ